MEIVQFAEAVARERGIELDKVMAAMEEAFSEIGRRKYGGHDIRASIDRKTGTIRVARYRLVTEQVEEPSAQITLEEAIKINAGIKVGEFIIDELPPLVFDRVTAQAVKTIMLKNINAAEREMHYEEYKDRIGEVVQGQVNRVDFGNVVVSLGRAEGLMRRDETLPREHFKVGDRVRAYIYDVRKEPRGPQIFLSRTHPTFMAKLFAQEVPEVYDGIIEIKAVARDPGSRAKIAVFSRDSSIDPVGSCVGMRGSRVQAVVSELHGEKVDIVPWSPDTATFVVNALAPAEVTKVVLDEEKKHMDVVVPDEQLSLAIGRRGQNVRLASMLTGWSIDIMTEAEESTSRAEEMKSRSQLFIDALDVDDVMAQLLVTEGFTTVEELVEVETDELSEIEGFDKDLATELKQRAKNWMEQKTKKLEARKLELGLSKELSETAGLDLECLVKLGEAGVKTLDDLADLASDELREILGKDKLKPKEADDIIMKARTHWFEEQK